MTSPNSRKAGAPASTRDQIVTEALHLFARKGYYGTSLSNIAEILGLTKQALIHHFGTKERLYGAVLEHVSDRFAAMAVITGDRQPEVALQDFYERFCAFALQYPEGIALVLRELLDDRQGADTASQQCLEPVLRRLVETVRQTGKWRDVPEPQALAVAYQLLGAVSCFVISEGTLSRLFGEAQFAETADIFPGEIRRTAGRLLLE